MNATHQRKVLLMNNITGELYNVEGVITSIMFSSYYYLYINLLETQLRTSLGILGDIIVLFDSWTNINLYNLFTILLANVGIFALMDRLLMAAFQRRSGPYNIGWFGLLQPIIDGIKLIKKEWIIVQQYNSIIWLSSPVFLFVFVLVVWSVIIYNYKVKLCDFIFSIVFQLVINTVDVLFLCLLGFAGNSKYSLIGCIRSAAQVLS